jgi:hypothetical protein
MTILSVMIVVYGAFLSGCLYFLIRDFNGQKKEEGSSNPITPDAAKKAFEGIKDIDRKGSDTQSELSSIFLESMKATLDKINAPREPKDKLTDGDRSEIKNMNLG